MDKNENEIWRALPGIPYVEVNPRGDVYVLDYVSCDDNGEHFKKGGIRKQYLNNNGYLTVSVRIDGKWVMKRVHRLVAEAFISNPNNLPQVNHKNCVRTDNRVSNLEWCDNSYNSQYREKNGVSNTETKGSPVFAINLNTLKVSCFPSQRKAGLNLGFSSTEIGRVVRGKRNQTHDYWFTNADNSAIKTVRRKFGDSIANKVAELLKETETK